MGDPPEIVLTNDDGIDSPGIRALHEALAAVANVTVVAPASDQSAVGRALSREVDVYEHDLGFAVDGTPADCVVAGLAELGPFPDLVVSGCNKGANLGEYVLGRSGTISAAVEAAFFDVPAIAASLYVPTGDREFDEIETAAADYREATRVTGYLAERALEAGVFEHADYLNVNAPLPDEAGGEPAPVEITRPSKRYDMDAFRDGDTVVLHDRMWEEMEAATVPDPPGTDRHAVANGRVSISPLTAPHSTNRHELLDALVEGYRETVSEEGGR